MTCSAAPNYGGSATANSRTHLVAKERWYIKTLSQNASRVEWGWIGERNSRHQVAKTASQFAIQTPSTFVTIAARRNETMRHVIADHLTDLDRY